MSNKETLQNYNNRLTGNNISLSSLINKIKDLPEPVEVKYQDKVTEITENGTTNIVPDEGYDALNSVEVTTNISGMNIFIQEDEPATKDGIWVKTNEEFNNLDVGRSGFDIGWLYNIGETPVNSAYNRVVKYQHYLYVFGGRDANNTPIDTAYKYNLDTNTYELITSLPEATIGPAIGIVGTKVYLFGGATASNTASTNSYVYDIETDSYSQITSLPEGRGQAGYVTVGTDIYITGGANGSSNLATVYKYDTLTDTYTKLTNMPIAYCTHSPVYKDGFIYTFTGLGGGYQTTAFKYDIENDAYTTITNYPIAMGHSVAGLIDNEIYIISGYYGAATERKQIYRYDTELNGYEQMPDIENTIFNAGYYSDGNIIYIVNGELIGSVDQSTVSIFGFVNKKVYDNNTILIATDEDRYATKLSNNLGVNFDKILLYDAINDIYSEDYETYYGNGTEWIEIE